MANNCCSGVGRRWRFLLRAGEWPISVVIENYLQQLICLPLCTLRLLHTRAAQSPAGRPSWHLPQDRPQSLRSFWTVHLPSSSLRPQLCYSNKKETKRCTQDFLRPRLIATGYFEGLIARCLMQRLNHLVLTWKPASMCCTYIFVNSFHMRHCCVPITLAMCCSNTKGLLSPSVMGRWGTEQTKQEVVNHVLILPCLKSQLREDSHHQSACFRQFNCKFQYRREIKKIHILPTVSGSASHQKYGTESTSTTAFQIIYYLMFLHSRFGLCKSWKRKLCTSSFPSASYLYLLTSQD